MQNCIDMQLIDCVEDDGTEAVVEDVTSTVRNNVQEGKATVKAKANEIKASKSNATVLLGSTATLIASSYLILQ